MRGMWREGFVAALVFVVGCDVKKGPAAPVSAGPQAPSATAAVASATSPAPSATPPTPSAPLTDAPPMVARSCVHDGKSGRDFEVGPGLKLTSLSDVPWESLGPGDTVRVHYRKEPYRDKILLSESGTEAAPIKLCGIPGPGGERPILDGHDATTRRSLAYSYVPQQDRGLLIVSLKSTDRYGYKPKHLVIEGLEVRNAHEEHSFTGAAGEPRKFLGLAAGIFIERGEDIVVRDCVIHGNGNGFFVASGDDEARLSRRITFEGNYVYANGTAGNKSFDRRHNIYTEAAGMTFQFNHIGPLIDGAGGSALKDRSAGTIVRYNWIDGGARQLDLVEAEDGWPMMKDLPEYPNAYVYGNVLISREMTSNVVHFGGDNGLEDKYRLGTLYFYGNTVVSIADQPKRWRTALFQAATNQQTIDVRDNVFFSTSVTPGTNPTSLVLMNQSGKAIVAKNVAGPALGPFSEGIEVKGKIEGLEKIQIVSTSPFVDLAKLDLRPKEGGPLVGAFVETSPKAPPISLEYVLHQSSRSRAPKDIGAFEH